MSKTTKGNSVFFNVEVDNLISDCLTPMSTINFDTSSDSFQNVLEDASQWEVCVRTFKLPSEGIDLIRLYKNQCLLSVDWDNNVQHQNADYNANTGTVSYLLNKCAVDLYQLAGGDVVGEPDPYRGGEKYIAIQSHVAFASLLDVALKFCITPRSALTQAYFSSGSSGGAMPTTADEDGAGAPAPQPPTLAPVEDDETPAGGNLMTARL